MKKLKYLLQLFDGVWSIPLAFTIFVGVGIVLQASGFAVGTYDPGFIQPLFLASAVVIGATNVAVVGIYFTFRGLWRYLYGQKKPAGMRCACPPNQCNCNGRINYSKKDWTALKPVHRFVVVFGIFIYFVTAIITVYLALV